MAGRITIFILAALLAWIAISDPNAAQIAAGIALFLFGMRFLEDGFRAFTGGLLESLLEKCAGRLSSAILFGLVATALVQSSSLVSVLAITFLSAGMLGLRGGIGIILGANLGTTTGAWLVAAYGFKVDMATLALPMLAVGAMLSFSRGGVRGAGLALAGIGFLFLGIQEMKDGFEVLRGAIDLSAFAVPGFTGLLIYAGLGAVATVVMQSSHATLILILTALASNQISYDLALALAVGANVGTTVTAIIGALGAEVGGRRLAAAHLVFNGLTGFVALAALPGFVWAVEFGAQWIGLGPDDMTLRLALFHTLFNLAGLILVVPLVGVLERLLPKLIPDKRDKLAKPRYLDRAALKFPETAQEAARKEAERLLARSGKIVGEILAVDPKSKEEVADSPPPSATLVPQDLYDRQFKPLHGALTEYISRAAANADNTHAADLMQLYRGTNLLAQVVKAAKHLHRNASGIGATGPEAAREEYVALRSQVVEMLAAVEHLRSQGRSARDILLLDDAKLALVRKDPFADGRLARMVSDKILTGALATSLVNDAGYVRAMVLSLAEAAAIILAPADTVPLEDLALDETDLRELAAAQGGPHGTDP
ncbi:MAG: Na/Pi cotransporter family protein [Rhodospirillaceae bacterium]